MGDVIQYRDYSKPAQRWANMEHFHRFVKAGKVPVETEMPCDVNPFEMDCLMFVAPDQDSA